MGVCYNCMKKNPNEIKKNQPKSYNLFKEQSLIKCNCQAEEIQKSTSSKDKCICKYKLNNNNNSNNEKYNLMHFIILDILGTGSFGKVYLVKMKNNNQVFALKSIKKSRLIKIKRILVERMILEKVKSPFIINMIGSFQDKSKFYFIMEFAYGGSLSFHLYNELYFVESKAKFYLCEIILALEELHNNDLIYRDLKPDNILIMKDGHIKLSDFGLVRINSLEDEDELMSFCGTKNYIAPEIYSHKYNKLVDIWSLGVLYYYMLTGKTPFQVEDNDSVTEILYTNTKLDIEKYILNKEEASLRNIPEKALDFILDMLNLSPEKRLGSKGYDQIKNHYYLKDINFDDVYNKKITPPFIPNTYNEDVCNTQFYKESAPFLKYFIKNNSLNSINDNLFDVINKRKDNDEVSHSLSLVSNFTYMK